MTTNLTIALYGCTALYQVHAFKHGVFSKFLLNGKGNTLKPALFFLCDLSGFLFLFKRHIIREHVKLFIIVIWDFFFGNQIACRNVHTPDQQILIDHTIICGKSSLHDCLSRTGIVINVPGSVSMLGILRP